MSNTTMKVVSKEAYLAEVARIKALREDPVEQQKRAETKSAHRRRIEKRIAEVVKANPVFATQNY